MPSTLVTGASSGIGLELAKQFAAGGDNVVLTARSEDKLVKIANDLEQLYNVSAIIIPSDLSKLEQVDLLYEKMNERGIQIDTIVKNAGFDRTPCWNSIHGTNQQLRERERVSGLDIASSMDQDSDTQPNNPIDDQRSFELKPSKSYYER